MFSVSRLEDGPARRGEDEQGDGGTNETTSRHRVWIP
jgi:hypothetical protein